MKKIYLLIIGFLFVFVSFCNAVTIEGAVTITDKVPQEFYGNWRVESVCTKSTDKEYLGTKSVDFWVLSRSGDTITLRNPLSGARADVTVNDVKGKTVKFEKRSYHPDEESIETPILTLQGDKFSGADKILIKTFKNGQLIKEDYIEYQVRGSKISGVGISGIFGF